MLFLIVVALFAQIILALKRQQGSPPHSQLRASHIQHSQVETLAQVPRGKLNPSQFQLYPVPPQFSDLEFLNHIEDGVIITNGECSEIFYFNKKIRDLLPGAAAEQQMLAQLKDAVLCDQGTHPSVLSGELSSTIKPANQVHLSVVEYIHAIMAQWGDSTATNQD